MMDIKNQWTQLAMCVGSKFWLSHYWVGNCNGKLVVGMLNLAFKHNRN